MTSESEIVASPLDRISAIMDSPVRPLDGALILRLRNVPALEALERGASSARAAYPVTRSILRGKMWRPIDRDETIVTGDDDAVEPFLESGAPVDGVPSPRQLLTKDRLITVGHHATGDLVSILAWVRHQLDVAFARPPPAVTPLVLNTCAASVRKSRWAWSGASTPLFSRGTTRGRRRRRAVRIEPFRPADASFTYNDVLLTVTMDLFAKWNAKHDAPTNRIAVWCPVNIRARPFDGFGNGSSRVRIYRTYTHETSFVDRCRAVHEQVQWTKAHGEWFVPTDHPLFSAPDWVIRMYLGRPWVDMATGPFSHGERIGLGPDDDLWPEVEDLEIFGQLDKRHPFGIFGATFRGLTRLTFLYDPDRLVVADVDWLQTEFESAYAAARDHLHG